MANSQRKRVAHNFQDITGQQFGRLTVIERDESPASGVAKWICKCQCGKTISVRTAVLRNGHSGSCGCLRVDVNSVTHRTHGQSQTAEYKIWKGIIKRCENPNAQHYESYGGRGISIHPDWRNDFPAFLAYVGPRPSSRHSIDRINCDGNYEPGNVRWAIQKKQANNKRNNHTLTLGDRTMTMMEWSDELGISYGTLKDRIKSGWSHERALTTPLLKAWSRNPPAKND